MQINSKLNSNPYDYLYLHVILGYLKDSNAAVHSVDSDISYAVIHLPVRSKTYVTFSSQSSVKS